MFFHPRVVDLLKEKYGMDVAWVLQREETLDHHKHAACLASEAETEESVIRTIAIERYIEEIKDDFDSLIEDIERAMVP